MGKNSMVNEWGLSDGNAFLASLDARETGVRITENALEAWLYLAPREDKPYTKEELLNLLKSEGVCHGINESNVAAMAKKKVYEREIKVATAVLPKEGANGYYEFSVPEEGLVKMPEIREDGSVDYRSMSVLTNVKEGDVVARYHKAEPGTPGMDVCGREIQVPQVRELPPLTGVGIRKSDSEPDVYVASTDGKVDYKDGKLSIQKVHEVRGDVDYVTGKIEFPGDVIVSGNVSAGVTIVAGKSLTIEGTVEAATLVAGEDIVLKRGIQGNHKASVITKGNFYADFVEHAKVQAAKSVQANSILNSQVYSGEKVILTGKRASIIGGFVHADMGIICKALGNDVNVKTVLHAGCEESVLDKFREITKEKSEAVEKKEVLEAELGDILKKKKKAGKLINSIEARCMKLISERKTLNEQLEDITAREAKCNEKILKCKDAYIRVEGDIYTGSVVSIGGSRLMIERNTSFMEYRAISGLIAGKVIALN